MTPDLINATFELLGGAFVALSVRRLWIDRSVKGSSPWTIAFFFLWGGWNLFYYPHLDQWLSFYGGLVVVLANGLWLVLFWRFR